MIDRGAKTYVADHTSMVGSAIVRRLDRDYFTDIITRSSAELDLRDQRQVRRFFDEVRPEYVFLPAAKGGGIMANSTNPAEIIYDNLMVEANVIHAAYEHDVKKLLFLASSSVYPKLSPQPIKEEYLLTGPLEETNEAYAVAQIAGIELCKFYRRQYGRDLISAVPSDLYGPNDDFDLETAHVLPALLRKLHEAKVKGAEEVVIWGTGEPRKEFLHVDDLADACLFLMDNHSDEMPINVGTGEDIRIIELAEIIADVMEIKVKIAKDMTRPDGAPRRLLDVSRLNALGWRHSIPLEEGIGRTYQWFLLEQGRPAPPMD